MQDLEDPQPAASEEKVREIIRSLPPAHANHGYRGRLRREFSTGMWNPPRPKPVLPPPLWLVVLRRSPLPAAIAAALLFAFLNRGPSWEVVAASPGGSAIVDGTMIPFSQTKTLRNAVNRGAKLRVPMGSELTFHSEGTLLVQAAPGTEMTLPSPGGRWMRKNLTARVDRGEARFLTGSRFPGRTLRVETPVGITEVTGTLFSVVADSTFTCVCVMDGTAWVGRSAKRMEAIPPGMRLVMFGDSRPQVVLPIEPIHAAALTRFRQNVSR